MLDDVDESDDFVRPLELGVGKYTTSVACEGFEGSTPLAANPKARASSTRIPLPAPTSSKVAAFLWRDMTFICARAGRVRAARVSS